MPPEPMPSQLETSTGDSKESPSSENRPPKLPSSDSTPEVLVERENQISFGGVALPDSRVLLPSLRFYNQQGKRSLSLYVVDRSGGGGAVCASPPLSRQDFEDDFGDQFSIR